MPPNPFDQACRYLLRRCPAPLLWLLDATEEVVLFIRWLNAKLTITSARKILTASAQAGALAPGPGQE